MEQTLIRHPRLTVTMKTGSEGPRHDPYSFVEYHVRTDRHEVVLHQGLKSWMKVNGIDRAKFCGRQNWRQDELERWFLEDQFPMFVGFTLCQIERIHRHLSSRCRHCGGTKFQDVDGYPGEHFMVCCSCGNVASSFFCVSEVM